MGSSSLALRHSPSPSTAPTSKPTVPMGDKVVRYRGCLAVMPSPATLAHLQRIVADHEAEAGGEIHGLSSADEWHITLVTKEEYKSMTPAQVDEAMMLPCRFFPIGVGGYATHGVFFIVCVWPKAQAFRQSLGLPRQPFHVTISQRNKHDVDKSFSSLIYAESAVATLDLAALEALSRQLLLETKNDDAFTVAVKMCEKFGATTSRGWVRLGDAAFGTHHTKLAMMSYARALSAELDHGLIKYCVDHMIRCSDTAEWGLVFHESETEQIPETLCCQLLRRWSPFAVQSIVDRFNDSSRLVLPSREHLHVLLTDKLQAQALPFYRLPRFFRWVVPFVLAGMSTPRHEEDIKHLASAVGIRHVVTLTEEEPLPAEWFMKYPTITNTFLPVKNYKAPTTEQIDIFMSLFSAEPTATPLLVHCGGGKGRAGVMIACYLVAYGFHAPIPASDWQHPAMTGSAAVETLRLLRPGSIETPEQEAAVAAYCSLLWKRQSVLPQPFPEPLPSKPSVQGADVSTTDLLVLCGLPGSGKSSFRAMLMKRARASDEGKSSRHAASPAWHELSGDEHGRSGCERSIGSAGRSGRVILDRCNGIPEDRRSFLKLAQNWSKHATAVWFDFPQDLCEFRAQQRAGHPTLPPGRRVRSAIADHSSTFVPPTLAEGFQSIVRITSIEATQLMVDMLSQPLKLLKFPRTPHLINLGAATEDDLVLSDSVHPDIVFGRSMPDTEIVITEKVDGANLGISLDHTGYGFVVQNRSHYISSGSHPQFRKLDSFLQNHRDDLIKLLARDPLFPERFIAYGEWLAATHSIPYSRLKSLFYIFGLYDRELQIFIDRHGLELLTQDLAIPIVPQLWKGPELPAQADLIAMVQQPSNLYDGRIEGIYIKWERDGTVKERAKVVRSDFIAGNEHWTKGPLRLNDVIP